MLEITKLLVSLDLQYFAAGDLTDDFDFDKFDEDFEKSIAADEEDNPEGEPTPEGGEVDEGQDENLSEEEPQGEQDQQQQEPTPDLTEEQKRNAAFAQLRRERDEAARKAAWLEKLAQDSGMTVEELQQRYEEQRLKKEAEQQGVPVEILQRLQKTEQENEQIKARLQAETFNKQVTETLAKYSGTEENFNNTIKYAQENGLFEALKAGAVTFEAAYKLAHIDTMLEEAKKSAVQEDLARQKKRQEEAPLAVGSGTPPSPTDDLDDQVMAEVAEMIKNGDF